LVWPYRGFRRCREEGAWDDEIAALSTHGTCLGRVRFGVGIVVRIVAAVILR
jgi:hypothetical protein